jgi:hypothetical protein
LVRFFRNRFAACDCLKNKTLYLEPRMQVHSGKRGCSPMSGIAGTEAVSPLHSYEAIKDEARLIQDSLLPGGTLHGAAFEVAYRYQPLVEVGESSRISSSCRMGWWDCTSGTWWVKA